jgi:uncharacterized surface protein with fasciclin (FAS1) repeats
MTASSARDDPRGQQLCDADTVSGGKLYLMMMVVEHRREGREGRRSRLTITDVRQSNGVIQVVDRVLHPGT